MQRAKVQINSVVGVDQQCGNHAANHAADLSLCIPSKKLNWIWDDWDNYIN